MKISFRERGTSQEPVSPAQVEMKTYRRAKIPVLKMALYALLLVALLGGGLALYKRNTLYTYGLVSGNQALVTAGFPTEIKGVFVAKGDIVKKGEVLFTQFSVEGEARIKEAEATLRAKMAAYDLMAGSGAFSQGDSAPLANEIDLLRLQQQGNALTRGRQLSEARYEMARLKTLFDAKNQRYENLQKLHRLDAATRSLVRAAETEKELLYHEYVLARDHHDRVLKATRIAEAEDRKAFRKRELALHRGSVEDQTDLQSLLAEVERARAQRDQLNRRYSSAGYKAPFDAVITEVNVTPGMVVNTGETILASTALGRLWVDVYVKPEKAALFTKEKEILLYSAGTGRSIPGTLLEKGGVELRVPEMLREKMPGKASAVYFHVAFENNGQLLPGNIIKVIVK